MLSSDCRIVEMKVKSEVVAGKRRTIRISLSTDSLHYPRSAFKENLGHSFRCWCFEYPPQILWCLVTQIWELSPRRIWLLFRHRHCFHFRLILTGSFTPKRAIEDDVSSDCGGLALTWFIFTAPQPAFSWKAWTPMELVNDCARLCISGTRFFLDSQTQPIRKLTGWLRPILW